MSQQNGNGKRYRIVQIRLKIGEEDDLIAWVDGQSNASEAIRQSMRLAMSLTGGDEDHLRVIVTEAMREVLADMAITVVQPGQPDNGHGEDPVLAARLDSLFEDYD